jgi:hypothetical protein
MLGLISWLILKVDLLRTCSAIHHPTSNTYYYSIGGSIDSAIDSAFDHDSDINSAFNTLSSVRIVEARWTEYRTGVQIPPPALTRGWVPFLSTVTEHNSVHARLFRLACAAHLHTIPLGLLGGLGIRDNMTLVYCYISIPHRPKPPWAAPLRSGS